MFLCVYVCMFVCFCVSHLYVFLENGAAHVAFAPRDRDAYEQLTSLKERIREANKSYPDRIRLFDNYKVIFGCFYCFSKINLNFFFEKKNIVCF